jgi:urease accessory protein
MDRGLVHDAWSVRRDGRLIWSDRFHAEDDMLRAALRHAAGLDGARAAAMLVYAGPNTADHLKLARALADSAPSDLRCAATVVNGVLVMRWLAPEAHRLRPSFAAAWVAMRAAARSLSPHLPSFWLH